MPVTLQYMIECVTVTGAGRSPSSSGGTFLMAAMKIGAATSSSSQTEPDQTGLAGPDYLATH